ncbi:MAG: TetR-like C-terminal domain-containing protein [Christensenellales bacterium]
MQDKYYEDGWAFLQDTCDYFYKNRKFYANALQVEDQNSFREYFSMVLKPLVTANMQEVYEGSENQAFLVEFFTDINLLALEKWLVWHEELSAEKFLELSREMLHVMAARIEKVTRKQGE